MIEINWTYVILFIIALIAMDKIITVINIKAVEKNYPDVDPLSIEKNPLAKEFFKQQGLLLGTLLYGLFSFFTFIIALLLLRWSLNLFHINNSFSISLYVLSIWYGIVIANNLFFLLKFSKIIP